MISERMFELGNKRSVIREIFEYAKTRAAEVGAENVFDFSIGNPNVPAPQEVKEVALRLLSQDPVSLHGYTSAQGDFDVRRKIAESLNRRYGTHFSAENFYMTAGAAAALCIVFRALSEEGDEFITFAPYFTEYKVFVEAAGSRLTVIPAEEKDFQIDFETLEKQLTPHTKGVLINSPNNPCGVVYREETIQKLAELLRKKSQEFGKPIFLITDEPYREIVYDGIRPPFVTKYYENTLVCYSFSKALSLPGERIGYVLVPQEVTDSKRVYAAVCGAGRALGYVCAPSMFQKIAAECCDCTADLSVYRKNRDLLYQSLTAMGFQCVRPDGAFYLFVKSPEPDAYRFYERGKAFDLLFVPGDDFGCPGYVRVAYCVQTEMIERALPRFRMLWESYEKEKQGK